MQPTLRQLCEENAQLLDEQYELLSEMKHLYRTKTRMPSDDLRRSAITAVVDQKTARTRDIAKRIAEISDLLERAI